MVKTQRISHILRSALASAVVAALLAAGAAAALRAHAAVAYSGSGTKNDPYLVQTAEQLDGMRNNLSAHYKLANTIDLSSYGRFTPISYEGAPFTGSFVCDTNADGTPKYAIKNLQVYIDAGEKYGHQYGTNAYVDYSEGKNRWQAALFGWAYGATFTNIAVLNADITNTVIGQNNMNGDWSLNPGQDKQQSTGILIGTALNTTITGCSSTGKITSSSNATGGLVGYLEEGSSLVNCYSTASVSSKGYWNTGGLVGACNGNLSSCFASGDVSGGSTEATTGGLVGAFTPASVISSCYSTGTVKTDGFCLLGYRMGQADKTPASVMYCYSTGAVEGYSSFDNGGSTYPDQNLFILSGVKGRQVGFTAASAADIKNAFAASGDWDVSGELPTLKNVHIIRDEAAYVPGAVTEVPQTQQPTENTGSAAGTQNTVSGGETVVVDLTALIDKMNALPDEDSISLDDFATVKEIQTEYDALSSDEQAEIPPEALGKFNTAKNAILPLVMADITKRVNELPDVDKLKASDYDTVMDIYADFEYIGDNAEFMEESIVDKLTKAVDRVKELSESGADTAATGAGAISTLEWILIGVLCLFILCALALEIFWTYSVCKKTRQLKESVSSETDNV